MDFHMGPALLFCPADRPDRYDKALDRADAVILDLEDAVAAADKDAARAALLARPLDPERTIVRVNAARTPEHPEDLDALRQTGYRTVMLAKAEEPQDLAGLADYAVLALCETARGVLAAAALAALDNVTALMWGAEDLVASLGGTSSRTGTGSYRDVARQARSQVLLAAGAWHKAAIDSVYLDLADPAGLADEAADAAASGFRAKAAIHPSQAEVIRRAFRPTEEEAAYAADLLEAARREAGAFRFRGRMVDEPLIRNARQTLRRAGRPLIE
ncbi:HpcH/HpaI aldolase/citrate lyase family protein [Arthrobacter mobilis]|uniref:CoA ester lyase n=1 Tax=Arthrobacter mobilis TaxID=2724944 RepID=A0A7X6K7P6_9MICC|nr:CoA ester lyase [Arthrobacter mobilis]NKX56654.1 CoA ester lyase [Arthrobacter mobilis]